MIEISGFVVYLFDFFLDWGFRFCFFENFVYFICNLCLNIIVIYMYYIIYIFFKRIFLYFLCKI